MFANIMCILIMSLSKGFHYRPLTIYSLVIWPAIGGAHGGRADCKGDGGSILTLGGKKR